jgi:hypothetical protein
MFHLLSLALAVRSVARGVRHAKGKEMWHKWAWSFLVPLVVALAIPASNKPATVIDHIEVRNGALGWGGIFIDATRGGVEKALHQRLRVEKYLEIIACGDYRSKIRLHGCDVTIQWSSAGLDGKVDSIMIPLRDPESSTQVRVLVERLMTRVPDLVEPRKSDDPTEYAAYLTPRGNARHAVMIKSIKETFVYIANAGCFD